MGKGRGRNGRIGMGKGRGGNGRIGMGKRGLDRNEESPYKESIKIITLTTKSGVCRSPNSSLSQ